MYWVNVFELIITVWVIFFFVLIGLVGRRPLGRRDPMWLRVLGFLWAIGGLSLPFMYFHYNDARNAEKNDLMPILLEFHNSKALYDAEETLEKAREELATSRANANGTGIDYAKETDEQRDQRTDAWIALYTAKQKRREAQDKAIRGYLVTRYGEDKVGRAEVFMKHNPGPYYYTMN